MENSEGEAKEERSDLELFRRSVDPLTAHVALVGELESFIRDALLTEDRDLSSVLVDDGRLVGFPVVLRNHVIDDSGAEDLVVKSLVVRKALENGPEQAVTPTHVLLNPEKVLERVLGVRARGQKVDFALPDGFKGSLLILGRSRSRKRVGS